MNFKFNEMSKQQKIGVGIGLLIVLFIGGIIYGSMINTKEKQVVIDEYMLEDLTVTEYTVDITSNKDEILEVTMKGNILEEELKDIATSLFEKNDILGKNKISVNIFQEEADDTNLDSFYKEGLLHKIVIDVEKSEAELSSYEVIEVDSTDALVDYQYKDLNAETTDLVLSVDMAIKEDSTDEFAMQQAKEFSILFREMNSDKDISSIELNVNPNDNIKRYNFHTDYEDLLEVIDVLPL